MRIGQLIWDRIWWKRLIKVGGFFLIIFILCELYLPPFSRKTVVVTIPRGADSFKIGQILSEKKVIANGSFFALVAKILRWEKYLKAGSYEFNSPSLIEALSKLKNGKIKVYKVTIPEGLPKWQVAEILERSGIVNKKDFLDVVNNPKIFKNDVSFPLPNDSLEGYLYPDTYYFAKDEDPVKVVKKFLFRFEKVVLPLYNQKNSKNNYSLNQIIILASIVEKEALVPSEKAIIAEVFYNRLRRGMRLRADPTVLYALGNFSERLSLRDLKTSSFYNTYLHYGLPPGPICSPGRQSIYATIHPASVNYLYFVAKGDGTHQFSRTYKQHLKAIYKYQRG